ncbi:acyltransferase [Demequina aurantiaca]|uniref:acyltransferase n=1 Tax=Demequina aurantiaca TaxID=676200 RepID=UPI0007863793|nr:acyltransferase [Demequina aurantiaca]
MSKQRNSVIEVYRILAMLAIVSYHYGVHGGVLGSAEPGDAERFLTGYSTMGKWGVDAFVLIGAYFMAQSTFRWRGLRSILIQVWSTSWMILVVALIWLPDRVDTETTWRAIFPVATEFYWFVTIYVMLMILSPFINLLVKAMTQRQHLTLIAILLVAWSLLSVIPDVKLGANSMTWFVALYLVAAYVAKYRLRGPAKWWAASAVGFAVLVPVTTLLASDVAAANPGLGFDPELMRSQYAPFVALSAISGLVAVTKMRPRVSPAVNTIAAATFGVYLIHDNAILRSLIWEDWVGTERAAADPSTLWWQAIGFTLIVYAAATAIELVRDRLVQRPLMRIGDRIFAPRARSGSSTGTTSDAGHGNDASSSREYVTSR